jgi:hypothetical protein
VALDHTSDIAHADRHALASVDHHVGDVVSARGDTDALDQARLPRSIERATANVHVVCLQRLGHVGQRQAETLERERVDDHLNLPFGPSPTVDLRDPRHGTELRLDVPVLHRAQLRERLALAGDEVVEDLSEAGRDRTELRPGDARRELHRL